MPRHRRPPISQQPGTFLLYQPITGEYAVEVPIEPERLLLAPNLALNGSIGTSIAYTPTNAPLDAEIDEYEDIDDLLWDIQDSNKYSICT